MQFFGENSTNHHNLNHMQNEMCILTLWNLITFKVKAFVLTFRQFYRKSMDLISNCLCQMQTTSMGAVLIASL